jgi:Rieske Fe-S protein
MSEHEENAEESSVEGDVESKGPVESSAEAPALEAEEGSRRMFLKAGVGIVGAGLACTVAVPAAKLLGFPLTHEVTSGSDAFVLVGRRDMFGPAPVKVDVFTDRVDAWNRAKQVKVGSAWVLEREGSLIALSTRCPHLGCAIDWNQDAGHFECPCHDSAFDERGVRREGPSPRDMDELEVGDDEGLVSIRYRRFKQGIEDKEPA